MSKILKIEVLTEKQVLAELGKLIDKACDYKSLKLTQMALTFCEKLEKQQLSKKQRAILDYFWSNAWANKRVLCRTSRKDIWAWDQEETQQQIFFLRRALNNSEYAQLPIVRQCQILTNLANSLHSIGRFIEAQALWRDCLCKQPDFWMARGNRGAGLRFYAQALYASEHKSVVASLGYKELTHTLRDSVKNPALGDVSARIHFEKEVASIEKEFNINKNVNYNKHNSNLSAEKDEYGYQRWCLDETLFLNPLNDLEANLFAVGDSLSLPNFVLPVGESPVLVGLFNQLKQEFVSARWLYFEGINEDREHPSDRGVLLINTLDDAVFGLSIEKIKISFRMSYSLLDKIAYFLNRYMSLGIPETKVNFRSVWREDPTFPIRKEFNSSENWPFRGLYWLSKDLFEKEFKSSTEPDSREFYELRNHLEHKYVKVHGVLVQPVESVDPPLFFDDFAHSLSRECLERRGLRILKVVRSALIYLSLGMHKEEQRRAGEGVKELIFPMYLDPH